MLTIPLALAWLAAVAPDPADVARAAAAAPLHLASAWPAGAMPGAGEARYAAAERLVSNWRGETLRALSPLPVAALAAGLRADRPVVTRCVKLNNYWCIKRAGWSGEIGFDDEGHVGFASAASGADAAVTLLRRYYLEFGRRSALDIVRRWAPPGACYAPGAPYTGPVIALRGIGNTLRARYLASRGIGRRAGGSRVRVASAGPVVPAPPPAPTGAGAGSPGPAAKPATRAATGPAAPARSAAPPKPVVAARSAPPPARSGISAVPLRPLPTFRVPDIAVGMGERRPVTLSAALTAPAPRRSAAPSAPPRIAPPARAASAAPAPRPAAAPKPAPRAPAVARPAGAAVAQTASATAAPAAPPVRMVCGSEETRIRNYAARLVEGLGLGPADDLALFEPDGRPRPNLARVLVAMSGFELGYLRAGTALVAAAVERQDRRARAAVAALAPAAPPEAGPAAPPEPPSAASRDASPESPPAAPPGGAP